VRHDSAFSVTSTCHFLTYMEFKMTFDENTLKATKKTFICLQLLPLRRTHILCMVSMQTFWTWCVCLIFSLFSNALRCIINSLLSVVHTPILLVHYCQDNGNLPSHLIIFVGLSRSRLVLFCVRISNTFVVLASQGLSRPHLQPREVQL